MKAIVRDAYGPPESLRLADVERPQPGPGEVLVRVCATGVNASDLEVLTGRPLYGRLWGFFRPKFAILGSDIAGEVAAVGPGASRFAVGTPVYGDAFGAWGGFAEWAAVPEAMLREKPAGMSFEQAAAMPQSGAIALQGVRDRGAARSGTRVLVNGAGGGVGTFAVQIARSLAAHVTAVDRGAKLETLLALGADRVIDCATEDFTRTSGPFDLVLDTTGHHTVLAFRRALAPGGRYLFVGGAMRLLLGVLLVGGLSTIFTSRKMGLLALEANRGLDALEGLFAEGRVEPVIDACYPLAETPAALRRLLDGEVTGKVVIRMPIADGARRP